MVRRPLAVYRGRVRRARWSADTALVFGGALALFATTVTEFEARVTDLSALRMVNGEVPYRDFWTMYAPGSFTTLALAFALFGRELIVSNLLGITTSAAAVALYYRLARAACGMTTAALLAALVAAAFFGTGYHDGFTSYPPAFLLIAAAARLLAQRCVEGGARWAVAPGLLLGLATLVKHDVGGYATIASGAALIVARRRRRLSPVLAPTLVVSAVVAVTLAIAGGLLLALGAGPDLWADLVRFPLTDFPYVRWEEFGLAPHWRGSLVATARQSINWSTVNLPIVAMLIGVYLLWRRRHDLDASSMFIVSFGVIAFWFHRMAAQVQLNTNAISLLAWSGLIVGVGLRAAGPRTASTVGYRVAAGAAAMCLTALFVAEPAYRTATRIGKYERLGVPQLRGIRVSRADVVWMRELAAAIADAADPPAPLLFLSRRNDIDVFAVSTPFWLTSRRFATRHHELHPGVTDTERVQREMVAQMERGSWPVVVREHRFDDRGLDIVKARIITHVPIGSTLIDEWVDRHYEPGPMFGDYEVMRRRSIPSALVGGDAAER